MTKPYVFDILIVYSGRTAISAAAPGSGIRAPFPNNLNIFYGYFLDICRKKRLRAALTTSSDIIGPGLCRSYWRFSGRRWFKANQLGYSRLIFDKLTPVGNRCKASRELLFSSDLVKPFNRPGLFRLFFDKQKTYDRLAQFSPPTVTIKKRTRTGVLAAGRQLAAMIKRHPFPGDFSGEVVMKDRFGAGGRNVYKFNAGDLAKMAAVMNRVNKIFILQPLVKFNNVDIRLIYLAGKIVQTYIRKAKAGDFRCNEHQGGRLIYIAQTAVPAAVSRLARKLVRVLRQTTAFFSLDFMVSNSGNAYLIEGNTGPGLDWNLAVRKNELAGQKLIRLVVKELARRV